MRRGHTTEAAISAGVSSRDRILAFMRFYYQKWGYPPSVQEICDEVGLSSKSTVHSHLETLVVEGRIVRSGPRQVLIPETRNAD